MPKVMPERRAGGGRRRGRRVTSSLAEINVIPLVDVMLVLLIVFMVAAPMLQKGVEVNLPVAQRSQRLNDQRIYVTVPLSYRKDQRVLPRRRRHPAHRAGRTHASGDGHGRPSARCSCAATAACSCRRSPRSWIASRPAASSASAS